MLIITQPDTRYQVLELTEGDYLTLQLACNSRLAIKDLGALRGDGEAELVFEHLVRLPHSNGAIKTWRILPFRLERVIPLNGLHVGVSWSKGQSAFLLALTTPTFSYYARAECGVALEALRFTLPRKHTSE